jgi:MFS family permease
LSNHPSSSAMPQIGFDTLRPGLFSLMLLCILFYCNFLGRVILGPLLLDIEANLGLNHSEASRLFLLAAGGYAVSLMASGFISSRFSHRRTVTISGLATGVALVGTSLSNNLWQLQLNIIFLGMATGIYLPSGMPSLASLFKPKLWGRVIGLHQLAPNLAFISAPLLAHWVTPLISWRGILGVIGVASIIITVFQLWLGKGGDFAGSAPRPGRIWSLIKNPNIIVIMGMQSIAISSQLGIYSLTPAFLVDEHGMDPLIAQSLLSSARLAPIAISLLAGWLVDRWGVSKSITVFSMVACLGTTAQGLAPTSWQYLLVILQPLAPACMFPACFVAMNQAVQPELRNLSVGLVVPVGYLVGGGLVPAVLGYLGDHGAFGLGFAGVGLISLSGVLLARRLKT